MANMQTMSWKDKLQRVRTQIANAKEQTKEAALELVGTTLAAGTALACGVLDQAKGVATPGDPSNITQHMLGPVPTSLAVAVLAKGGGIALSMSGESIGKQVSAIGQGALDAAAYVAGRKIWAKHEAGT